MAESIYDRIHRQIDIVEVISDYLPLAKKGRSFVGLCPFHEDKDPSLSISPEKQVYNCFSCGNKGDVIKFVAEFEKISREKAVTKLAARLGISYEATSAAPIYTATQQALLDALRDAMTYFAYCYDINIGTAARQYALARGLSKNIQQTFLIGYAPPGSELRTILLSKGHDEANLINASLINGRGESFFANRLIFGISNEHGDVVAFSARAISEQSPKYLNSAESQVFHKSALLYNFNQARDSISASKSLYLCEGQMDVIALNRAGFKNSVAVMGTALTKEHLALLEINTEVIVNFDADRAGQTATFKAIELLDANGFKVSVLQNEAAKDADAIMAASGVAGIKALVSTKMSALTWLSQYLLNNLPKPVAAGNLTQLFKDLSALYSHSTALEQELVLNQLASALNLAKEFIASELVKLVLPERQSRLGALEVSNVKTRVPKVSFSPRRLRYAHMLLKSMLLTPSLVQYYRAHANTVLLAQTQLASLARYLASNVQETTLDSVPMELTAIVALLEGETIKSVQTEQEFQELITRVNIEFYNYFINIYLDKLKAPATIEEISEINKAISSFKAKKEEIYAKK